MRNIKKIIAVFSIIALSLTVFPTVNNVNAWSACLSCSPLSSKEINDGGQIIFTLKYTNDINQITLNTNDLRLDGFSANVYIGINGNNRVVTLTNIHSTSANTQKSVYVSGGTALSSDVKQSNAIQTETFTIRSASNNNNNNNNNNNTTQDTIAPVATISGPSSASVYAGGTVVYKITYTDNVGIYKVTLNADDIRLSGFTANKNISINGNVATITLTNVQGAVGSNKVMYVSGGTAIDAAFNQCNAVTGSAFSIVSNQNNNNNNNNSNTSGGNAQTTTTNNNNGSARPSDWVANPNTGIM